MDKLTVTTATDIFDYTALTLATTEHPRPGAPLTPDPLEGDSLIVAGFNGSHLGAVLRLRDCRHPQGAAQRLRLALEDYTGGAMFHGAVIFTGALATDTDACATVLEQLGPFFITAAAYTLHEGTWIDLHTWNSGTYTPGASEFARALHTRLEAPHS